MGLLCSMGKSCSLETNSISFLNLSQSLTINDGNLFTFLHLCSFTCHMEEGTKKVLDERGVICKKLKNDRSQGVVTVQKAARMFNIICLHPL